MSATATPWAARLLVAFIVGYALSPIDRIPDFIPVLGYLDELILLPMLLVLALRMIPAPVLTECRELTACMADSPKPVSGIAGVMIFMIWLLAIAVTGRWAYDLLTISHARPQFEPRKHPS